MKDGPIRTSLKFIARAIFWCDLWVTRRIRRARGESPYLLGGKCALCAKCCESPAIQTGFFTFRMRSLRALFLAWQRLVNGFILESTEPRTRTFVFRCTHFNWTTRKCDSYHSRPGMCRDYPRLLLWEGEPPFLDGCGYRAVSPHADRVTELLRQENLPDEKIEELQEKLHLKK